MKTTHRTDGRNLPQEIQQHNRNQAIRLFQEGKPRKEIAAIVQVHYIVICRWIRAWQRGGDDAIQLKKRGRTSGNQRSLTEEQNPKAVKKWLNETYPEIQRLAKHDDEMEVFYLPAYSPELNPDEYLNCDLKTGIRSSSPARNPKELKQKVLSHMRMLQ